MGSIYNHRNDAGFWQYTSRIILCTIKHGNGTKWGACTPTPPTRWNTTQSPKPFLLKSQLKTVAWTSLQTQYWGGEHRDPVNNKSPHLGFRMKVGIKSAKDGFFSYTRSAIAAGTWVTIFIWTNKLVSYETTFSCGIFVFIEAQKFWQVRWRAFKNCSARDFLSSAIFRLPKRSRIMYYFKGICEN